jgi:hypothetical protein
MTTVNDGNARHMLTRKTWHGRTSARCSCGASWGELGYATDAGRRGESGMIDHMRETDAAGLTTIVITKRAAR